LPLFLPLPLTAITMGTVGAVVAAGGNHDDNDNSGMSSKNASRISSEGQSVSWNKQKLNVRNLYNGFQQSIAEVQDKFPGKAFTDITMEQSCSKDLYKPFAGW
jgi:hypothetical protein